MPAVLAALAIFANAVPGDMVYDDLRQIGRNALIQDPAKFWRALTSDVWAFKGGGGIVASNYWRPTFVFWLILNYRAFALAPAGWHATSLLLHAVVTALAYALGRRLDLARPIAAAIAIVFAVHPVHTETVAWISGSPDLLLSIGWLGAMHAVLTLLDRATPGRWAAALALYAIALGAKEVSILFPVMVVVLARWRAPESRTSWTAALRIAGPFAIAAAGYFVIRLGIIGQFTRPADQSVGLVAGVLSAPAALVFYLRQTFLPWPIGPSYPLRPLTPSSMTASAVLVPAIIASIAAIAALVLARRPRTGAIGLALFVLPLAPALNVAAFIPDQMVHDRYLYLPLLGALLLVVPAVGDGLARLWRAAPDRAGVAIAAGAAIVCVPLGVQTWRYNRAWTSSLRLWERAVATDPTSSFNFTQYAAVLTDLQRYDDAAAAADRAIAIAPSASARLNRGRIRLAQGRLDLAAADLQAVIDLPDGRIDAYTLYQGYEGLAIVYQQAQQLDRAAALLRAARVRLPIYHAALTEKLAIVLYQANLRPAALAELEGARAQARVELLPESRAVLLRIGLLDAELGRAADARRALQEYLALVAPYTDEQSTAGRAQAEQLLRQLH